MAINVCIDTNSYTGFVKANPEVIELFRAANTIYVPIIVVAELRAGFMNGTKSQDNQRVFEQFLHSKRVEVISPSLETTHLYAQLYTQLRKAGTPIPTNDLWIASLALQFELPLCTLDKHFDVIPQLVTLPR